MSARLGGFKQREELKIQTFGSLRFSRPTQSITFTTFLFRSSKQRNNKMLVHLDDKTSVYNSGKVSQVFIEN